MGTTIAACGQGLNSHIWNGSPNYNCTAGGVTVPAFPLGLANQFIPQFATAMPHGPFPVQTSTVSDACLICGGGEYGGESSGNPEGYGWNTNGAGEQISNLTLDLGGGNPNPSTMVIPTAVFGYYTLSSQERTTFSNIKWTDYPPAGGAGFFFDRTEAPTAGVGSSNPAGTTRPVLRDLSLTGAGVPCSNPCYAYGIVQEGANTQITFGSTTGTPCNPYPIAWVSAVVSGNITGITVGSGGNCPVATQGNITCSITAAPATYPFGTGANPTAVCTGLLNFMGTTSLQGITVPITPTSAFPQGLNSGGMILENVNLFATDASNSTIQDGVWIEGVVNPLVGHLHCQGMNTASPGYCEHMGAGHPVFGGSFLTHDVLNLAAGTELLGPGVDNNQTFVSISATGSTQNLIYDQKNGGPGGLQLTSATYGGEIAQYQPGSMLTAAALGPTLYNHLNNQLNPGPINSSKQRQLGHLHAGVNEFLHDPVCSSLDQHACVCRERSESPSSLSGDPLHHAAHPDVSS
jgi:hypothetical protein